MAQWTDVNTLRCYRKSDVNALSIYKRRKTAACDVIPTEKRRMKEVGWHYRILLGYSIGSFNLCWKGLVGTPKWHIIYAKNVYKQNQTNAKTCKNRDIIYIYIYKYIPKKQHKTVSLFVASKSHTCKHDVPIRRRQIFLAGQDLIDDVAVGEHGQKTCTHLSTSSETSHASMFNTV